MTSNSFAGGNVLDWPSLVSAANSNGVSTPTYLPTSALISFTHHEMYLSDEDTPLEFLFSPAQFHIYYWDAITNGDVNTDAGALTRVNLYETASQAFGAVSTYLICRTDLVLTCSFVDRTKIFRQSRCNQCYLANSCCFNCTFV